MPPSSRPSGSTQDSHWTRPATRLRDARGSQRATLKLTEIFYSLQGEADTVGMPTVFVRLTGCPLRCAYCDTAYAFTAATGGSIGAILARVR